MGSHVLSIGRIPENNKSDRIVCGDPSASGTVEVNIWMDENMESISCPDLELKIDVPDGEFWDTEAPLWKKIGDALFARIGKKLKIDDLFMDCLSCIILQTEPASKVRIVASDDDGGEFLNDNGIYNGKWYFRYQYQKTKSKYEHERVVVRLT